MNYFFKRYFEIVICVSVCFKIRCKNYKVNYNDKAFGCTFHFKHIRAFVTEVCVGEGNS